MTTDLQLSNKWNHPKFIYFFAVLLSAFLSIWLACREVLINPDAICYLQSAAVIGNGGLRKAMILCPQAQWPLYSVLIYFFSYFTHFSLTVSAYTLDGIFSALTVLTFLGLARQLGAKGRVVNLSKLFVPEKSKVCEFVTGENGADAGRNLALKLRAAKLI